MGLKDETFLIKEKQITDLWDFISVVCFYCIIHIEHILLANTVDVIISTSI